MIEKLKQMGIDCVILNGTVFIVDEEGQLLMAEAIRNYLVNYRTYNK